MLGRRAALIGLLLYFITVALFFTCDPYGDEAWYYYISKELKWNWDPHLSFLPPIRWAYMVIMHPFTINFTVYKIAYSIINSVPLVLVKGMAGLIASIVYSLPPMTFFVAHPFTSTLAATFTFLTVYFFDKGSFPLTFVFALLAVGSWEGSLFVPLAISLIYWIRKRRFKALMMLIPPTLALATSYDNLLFHSSPPGWAKGPLTLSAIVDDFLFPISLFPIIKALYDEKWDDLLIMLSMPLGLITVNIINKTMIEVWYLAVNQAIFAYYIMKYKWDKDALALMLLVSVLVYLGSMGVGAKMCGEARHCCLVKIAKELKGKKVVLYKLFWAYSHFPFQCGKLLKCRVCYSKTCLRWTPKGYRYVVSSEPLNLKLIESCKSFDRYFVYER